MQFQRSHVYASHFFKLTRAHKLEKSDNLSEKKLILQKYTTKNLLSQNQKNNLLEN